MSVQRPERPEREALRELAAEAYVYGYSLVLNLGMVENCLRRGVGLLPARPFNEFAHAARLAEPGERAVSVNNDTLNSVAQVDLSAGPVYLHVPDTAGAYHVLQFVDAWMNNFAYLGSRATGTTASDWLIVPPGWEGETPHTVRDVVRAPTSIVSVVGRFACDGPDDLPRVRGLQEQLTLTPPRASAGGDGLPPPDAVVRDELVFFERLRVWLADFPPAAAERDYQQRFAPLGLLEEGRSPYGTADSTFVRTLVEGREAARERIEEAARPVREPAGGDWHAQPHQFDYNIDHLGIGTIDSPRWKMTDRRSAHLARAVAARTALWGSHGYEVTAATTSTDAAGEQLDGAHSYLLRLPEPLPVDAFWSLSMYETPEMQLVGNPAGRYSVGDRTPGLVRGEDGSLTVVVQRERPADESEAANWLPAPGGGFRLTLRLYCPQEAVLEGGYRLPPLRRR
ncbi:DUF1254 domain-containing protein [Streptomyces sp. NPDC059740]|uniref:DUF1254 domain-containing protein n=1 Tax=Streptomyces sp. NPDC059740 TaxID=3346926 RepID=UPI00365BC592